MIEKDPSKLFERLGDDYKVWASFYEDERGFTIETLYQTFKARLLREIMEQLTDPKNDETND